MNVIDNWDEYFMRLAYLTSYKSKDESTKIGAVLVRDNMIISTGFNGLPKKVLDPYDYENKLTKFKHELGKKGLSTFSAEEIYEKIKNRKERPDKYNFVSHAEVNTLWAAARNGISTNNSILYTQAIPCNECAKGIIQSGVSKVIVHKPFSDIFYESDKWKPILQVTLDMFNEAGVKLVYMKDNLGEIGFIGGKEYQL